jgi:hypothetical protein
MLEKADVTQGEPWARNVTGFSFFMEEKATLILTFMPIKGGIDRNFTK